MLSKRKGFTLVELMVVILIISILALVIVPKAIRHIQDAQDAKASKDLQSIYTGITMYLNDNDSYPNNWDDLSSYLQIDKYKNDYEINSNI